jgi:hypothetical protein
VSGNLRANQPVASSDEVGCCGCDLQQRGDGHHRRLPVISVGEPWRWSPFALVLVVVVAMVALNLWWWLSYRRGFPLHIDESGYTAFALAQTQALHRSGLGGLLHSVETQQTVFAPLVPFLTVPLEVIAGQRIGNGYVVILGFYALLVLVTYDIARRVVSPRLAAVGAVVVAAAPEVLTFARAYYFALPAAALLAAAVACFLRSEVLTRTPWVLAGGFVLGLAVLSRTQMLAAVPCVLAAGSVQALALRDRYRPQRLANLGGAALVAALVAATWYGRNFGDAVGFLRGTRFRAGTPVSGSFHVHSILRFLGQVVNTTQLPVAIVLLGATIGALTRFSRRTRFSRARRSTERWRWPRGPKDAERSFLLLTATALIVVFAAAEFAVGVFPAGIWLLVVPILVPLALVALGTLTSRIRHALGALLVVLSVVNVAMVSGMAPSLATVRTIGAGPVGSLTITDGRQFIQQSFGSFPAGSPGQLPDSYQRLPALQRSTTAWLVNYAAERGQRPVVFAVGGESRFLNINDLALADRLRERRGLLITGRVDVPAAAPVARYCPWLDDPRRGLPNFLTIHHGRTPPSRREPPLPAETRAERFRFRLVQVVELPDGPTFIYWRSQALAPKRCPY